MSSIASAAAGPVGSEPAPLSLKRIFTSELEVDIPVGYRFLLGGCGALVPITLNLALIDPHSMNQPAIGLEVAALWFLLAYLGKTFALFLVGGLMAARRDRERNPWRLIEAGIVAPALIATAVHGTFGQHERQAAAHELAPPAAAASFGWGFSLLVSPAHALEHALAQQPAPLSFRRPPPESVGQQLVRGVTGQTSRGAHFVFVDEAFSRPEDAYARLAAIERATGIRGRVYDRDGPRNGFVVVLGDWMRPADALRLRDDLRRRQTTFAVDTWALSRG